MKKNNNTSSVISSLSVKKISSIFFRIDEQIIALHNCSSEDFLGLNTDFKKYYKQSKLISSNAGEMFKLLTEGGSGDLFKQLQNLYKDLKSVQDRFVGQLDLSIKKLKTIQSLLDQLFLPIKNLNQDLLTLKFLLANLKLSSSDPSNKSTSEWENLLSDYNKIINDFKQCGFDSDKSISRLREDITNSLVNFESIQSRTVADLDSILNNIHFGIILFAEKHEETTRQIPELTQKTESCSKSIADIITNLQYQDIIRQKIEHIQTTQKNILDELERFGETIEITDTENQTRLYLKIRDIAGLQAAILVKANKEYQLAIEKITGEFVAIGADMTGISSMCTKLNLSQENSEEIHFTEMLQKLQNSAQVLTNFIDAGNDYIIQIDNLGLKVKDAREGFVGIKNVSNKLEKVTSSLICHFKNKHSEDSRFNEILTQVTTVNEDIQKFEVTIQDVFQKVIQSEKELSDEVIKKNNSFGQEKFFTQSAENMNAILIELNSKSDRINFLLNETIELSKDISLGVKASIKQIRYYDLFEKTIIDIINELNEIYQKLKGEISEEQGKEENLNSVKDLYTMESEHQIHQKIIQSDGELDLFGDGDSIDNADKNKDSDEVELF